jgi:hypothetical protein
VRLHNAFNNGTLCAADLSIKKFVLRSQTGDTKEKETKIGEDGELTIRSREEDTVNCGSLSDVLVALETRGNTLLAAGFRPVRPVPGMTGMYTRGEHGWQFYDKVADPHTAGVMVNPDPPGFWYYFDPQAAKKYQMMILHSLRIRHVQDIVVGDGLMMEQIVNKVGEGFNLSSAMIDTLDSTTMTQLLQASGYRLLRPINGKPTPGVGHQNNGDNGAGRGTKRAVPNGRGPHGKGARGSAPDLPEFKSGMDPCQKYGDGLCNVWNGPGRGCFRPNCPYRHDCRVCHGQDHGAATCAKRPKR